MNLASTLLQTLALLGLIVASTSAPCQVYKSVDPGGKVQYSDRPPPGTALAAPKSDAAFRELQGTWIVANATQAGELFVDPKIVGATWTFRDSELVMEPRSGDKGRFNVRLEAGASPKAFLVTPVQPSSERGGWMIYAREGSRLRIGLIDNLDVRPTGFEPQRKLIVVTLVAKGDSADGKGAALTSKQNACEILRAAGIMDLLGPTAQSVTDDRAAPGTQCRFEQPRGVVMLNLFPATNRATLERERERQDKRVPTSAARMVVQDEPEFGPSAFSVTMGNSVQTYVLKGDTMIMLGIQMLAGEPARNKAFVRRVIAAS